MVHARMTEAQYRATYRRLTGHEPDMSIARPAAEAGSAAAAGAAAHKYGAVPVCVDGERFDSTGEAARWQTLQAMQKAGEIADLTRDRAALTYDLVVNDVKICHYVADFGYTLTATGGYVVEDFKGVQTPIFKLKAKLLLACHGVTVTITGREDLMR